jgi:2-hydroxychromene-2-carboxylate isomerase
MTAPIDLYWSFRSPYCYLLGVQLRQALERFDACVTLKPVYPAAVRNTEFFERVDPLWFSYFALDVRRAAELLEVPIRWPNPDPVAVAPGTQKPLPEQPLIRRLTRLGVAANEQGAGLRFVEAVGDILWRGDVDGWHEGDHLRRALSGCGIDLDEFDAIIVRDLDRIDAVIVQNESDQRAAGHWGVPLMVLDGEPFFGQDRLPTLLWRLEQRRNAASVAVSAD